MPKKPDDDSDQPKKLSSYTIKLDDTQMETLRAICTKREWMPAEVPYTRFAFKADHLKINVTAYTSGKVVIAGKGTEDFVRDVIEPEVTKAAKLGYDEVLNPDWFEAHAGLDAWRKAGAQDSKKMAESKILELDHIIRNTPGVVVKVCFCGMPKYNELMARPRANLNLLLAWQHATALSQALAISPVKWGLLDQFTEQPLVQRELAKKKVENFELRMRTKAESDPVVAAASIVARAEFVRQMNQLSKQFGQKLQKGAGPLVRAQAHDIIKNLGVHALKDYAKLHFRTAYEVVKEAGKLDELPLPEPKERFGFGRD